MLIAVLLLVAVLSVGVLLIRAGGSVCSELGMALIAGSILALALLAAETLLEDRRSRSADHRNLLLMIAVQDDLQGIGLEGEDLSGQYLAGKNLTDARLRRIDGSYSSFNKSTLDFADLGNADLRHATFYDARLPGADLRGADLTCARLTGTRFYVELEGFPTLANAKLEGANLNNIIYNSSTVWPNGFNPPPSLTEADHRIKCDN